MPLEATVICVDNSDWMRNADYEPTRRIAQNETVHYLCNAKLNSNQESEVGFLSMAGPRVEVGSSPCRLMGKLMTTLGKVEIGGKCNFLSALKTAQLVLKNRQNKNQRQRVIMFVGSPVEEDSKKLSKVGKIFKKNNIAVDIVNFGTENVTNENEEKLRSLVDAANSNDNSHLVSVPPGPQLLTDVVMSSAILFAGGNTSGVSGASSAGATGAATSPSFGGVDPNVDPELAEALRMSMEEERKRQEAATQAAISESAGDVAMPDADADADEDEDEDEDDEAMLAQAIALSMGAANAGGNDDDDGDADEILANAEEEVEDEDIQEALRDPSFVQSLLDTTGVEKDDVELDDILAKLTADGDEDDEDEDDE